MIQSTVAKVYQEIPSTTDSKTQLYITGTAYDKLGNQQGIDYTTQTQLLLPVAS